MDYQYLFYRNDKFANSYILFSKTSGTVEEIIGFDKLDTIKDLGYKLLVKKGTKIERYQYLAVIYFSSFSFNKMCDTLSFINSNIKILDESRTNMIIYYDDFDTLNDIYKKRNEYSKQEDKNDY